MQKQEKAWEFFFYITTKANDKKQQVRNSIPCDQEQSQRWDHQ